MQEWIVGVAVVLAGVYAFWSFMPAAWRRHLASRLGWQKAASIGSCHACDECSGCSPKPPVNHEGRGH